MRTLAPAGRSTYGARPAAAAICCALTARPDAVYIHAANGENMLRVLAGADSKSPMPKFVAVDDVHRMDDNRQAGLFALATAGANPPPPAAPSRWPWPATAPAVHAAARDLRTRLGWDLVFRLDPLSDADKLAALSAQAAERGMHLAPEIINWMLTHHERDIRKLAALIDALDRYSLANGRPITLPLLRAMLADPDSQPK